LFIIKPKDIPDVIKPDVSAGTKRWILAGVAGATQWMDVLRTIQESGNIVIKNQGGSTIATFANGLTLALPNGGAIDEFSSDGTLGGDSDAAVPTEKAVKAYVDNNVGLSRANQPAQFTWVDADTITLGAASYYHVGTSTQQVYWDSAITFDFGPGGSNAGNEALGATEWHYIYLDDSAIITQGTALLDADCFIHGTTAPTWVESKHGFYVSNDRCIFAVYTDGANAIEEFHQYGPLIRFADQYTLRTNIDRDAVYIDETCVAPGFCRRGLLHGRHSGNASASAYLNIRVNGQTGAVGNNAVFSSTNNACGGEFQPILDSSQIFELKFTAGGNNRLHLHSVGWYLPPDMY
jgi:hypothetical protein